MASVHEPTHLGLLPRCGACADMIFRHERTVALYGNEDSTVYRGRTRPFAFPCLSRPGWLAVDGFRLCQWLSCDICFRSSECIPIHYDCFNIFIQECPLPEPEALDRLWTIGSYRSPWPRAKCLRLTPRVHIDPAALTRIAQTSELKPLSCLPLELIQSIRQQAPHELFWRAVAVIGMVARLTPLSEPLLSFPLNNVGYWQRGGQLLSVFERPGPVIRLTIDSDGIQQIERLPERPTYRDERRNQLAYIVEEKESLSEVEVHIKDGLLRLRLPSHVTHLQVWDVPAPPALDDCIFFPTLNAAWKRFRTVNLSRIRGITFFFAGGQIYGIHVHDSPNSHALSTYLRLAPRRRKVMAWIYFPIAKSDRVIALGSGQSGYGTYILIRTELMSDTVLGTKRTSAMNDRLLSADWPIILVYGEPSDDNYIPFMGAYRPASSESPLSFEGFQANDVVSDGHGTYFSSAPLSNIIHAHVFHDKETGCCLGILFQYENNGLRAVGQCRLQVDSSEKYTNPSRICIQEVSIRPKPRMRLARAFRVAFEADNHEKYHDESLWQCYSLNGILKFWFTTRLRSTRITHIEIDDGSDEFPIEDG